MTTRRVLLIRRRRPVGEPADPRAGAGRMLDVLAGLGVDLRASDVILTPWLLPPVPDVADLDDGPSGPFETVVLGSHLVNAPDEAVRHALLGAVAARLGEGATALIEHHPLDSLETAAQSWSERDGQRLGMIEVQIAAPFVSAVSVFEAGGAVVRQPFRAIVLADEALDRALADAGLARRRRLGPTWIEAGFASLP